MSGLKDRFADIYWCGKICVIDLIIAQRLKWDLGWFGLLMFEGFITGWEFVSQLFNFKLKKFLYIFLYIWYILTFWERSLL